MLLEQGPGSFCKFALLGGRSCTAELPWWPARYDGLSGMMKQQSEMQRRPSVTCCERFIIVQPSIMRLGCVCKGPVSGTVWVRKLAGATSEVC